jgi:hypothetical protein
LEILQMNKRLVFCAIFCIATTLTSSVAKAGIIFDANGAAAGGDVTIDGIDWGVGNALAVGGNASIATFLATGGDSSGPKVGTVQTPFKLFFQASMASTSLNGLINTPAGGVGRFSVVGAITEIVTAATGIGAGNTVTFDLAPVQTHNYFEIFYDPTPSQSDLLGTGYNGYAALPAIGAFGTGTNTGLAANPDAIRVLGGTVTSALVSTFSSFGLNPTALDGVGTNNYNPLRTVSGGGLTTLDIIVNPVFVNPLFFRGDAIDDFTFSTQAGVPFGTGLSVNPSARFLTSSTTTAVGVTPTIAGAGLGAASLGLLNGGNPVAADPLLRGGPDFQFAVDGSSALSAVAAIPEPTSIAVFGVFAGLAALRFNRGSSVRRK